MSTGGKKTEWFNKNVCHTNKIFTTTENGVTSYDDDKINKAINNIVINKLDSEKANIENIAMNVIAEYKSKLTEHINETIYKELIDGLDIEFDTIKSKILINKM